jgi:predicted nuclease with TOPRIM domain
LKQQNASTAEHQSTQRETIKQLRESLAQLREAEQLAQMSQQQLKEQNQQLLEQVAFVKTNSAATIERLTNNWEQAQAKIRHLEQASLA